LDSGAFSEISRHGRWTVTAAGYVTHVRRYRDEIGRLAWASPQDWMCEPHILAVTGLSVREHQERTVANVVELRSLAPDLPFVPVLQGWTLQDYLRCVELYREYGVDLRREPLVGLGSVCRRQGTQEIGEIVESLAGSQTARLRRQNLRAAPLRPASVQRRQHGMESPRPVRGTMLPPPPRPAAGEIGGQLPTFCTGVAHRDHPGRHSRTLTVMLGQFKQ
jgi:hypothetical protein